MVSLADLRARDVVPTWQEAVAVVQELLHTVVATQGSADRLPDLEHIALIANGDVVALPGGSSMEHPVRHLAQLLRVLLDRSAAPPQLQEFVVANLHDPPQIDTVEEFSIQLAFFERPGRRSDVEALVSRALSTESQAQADEELKRLKAKTLEAAEHAEQPQQQKEPSRLQSRQAVVVVLLFVLVSMAGTAWWLLGGDGNEGRAAQSGPADGSEAGQVPRSGPAGDGSEVGGVPRSGPAEDAPATNPTDQPVGTASASASRNGDQPAPSLLDRTKSSLQRAVQFAFGSSDSAQEAQPETAAADPETAGTEPGQAPKRAATTRRPGRGASTGPATRRVEAPTVRPEPPQVSTVVTTPPVTGEGPTSVATMTVAPTVVYTAADSDVMPAMLLRPVLPAMPPPDVPPSQIGTLELVVDEQGDVERVRLVSPSNRFHERMLVAHAKTWKFRPAIRDGQPVKFRTVVRLTI